MNQKEYIVLSNVSSLPLTSHINTNSPFTILNEDTKEYISEILLNIKTGESKKLVINFDPSFKRDFHNEVINGQLVVTYVEHQHTVNKYKYLNDKI